MTELEYELLTYLREQCAKPGGAYGVPPVRIRQDLAITDLELMKAVQGLRKLGLAGYDGVATSPFNDPDTLSGYKLLNVYLSVEG